MVVRRQNITIDSQVFEDFCKYAGLKGIKISIWVTANMKEFVEDDGRVKEK